MSLVISLMILVMLHLRCISRSLGFPLKQVRNFVTFLNWCVLLIGLLRFSLICFRSVIMICLIFNQLLRVMSKYFHPLEFKACIPSCDISQMNSAFLGKLDLLRDICGFPLVLNCAFRTSGWDKSKGRSGNSYHTKGLAVDIRCYDALKRAKIVCGALVLGLSVGVYSSFIHIDMRSEDKQVCFYGISYELSSSTIYQD